MQEAQLSFGPFVLSPGKELRRDGNVVPLGHRALALLEAMLRADGEAVTKAEILEKVWPGVTVEEGNITVQVAALRKELGTRPNGEDWIATVPRIGYRLLREVPPAPVEAESDGGKPTVAVLPFVNLSGDATRDYFADGIVEDLITALSRFKSFSVVSRFSSFAYKGRAIDIRQVALELGVRYMLEGSVRLSGDRVRVTVQLVDAASGTHLWATNFDGELGQIFEFQDRVTESVVGFVEPQIRRAEIERTRRRWPDSPQAYDHFLRALPHFNSNRPADYLTARGHLEQAIVLQPDYAQALAYASWSYARRGTVALEPMSPGDVKNCLALASSAMNFGSDDPVVLAICAHSLIAAGRMHVEGLAAADRALSANPNNLVVLQLTAICNMLVGDATKAETSAYRAYRLSPGAPEAAECLSLVGFARFGQQDYEGAVVPMEQARAILTEWPPNHWMLAATYAHLGRLDDAHRLLAKTRELAPNLSLASIQIVVDRSDGRLTTLADGLRIAGLQ
jgi:TolB-like protein/Flp pilus assembly protein TadD